jgi:myo-inositol-1(or 4)-monophosphatase
MDELYTAERGGGAFVNDRRLRVAGRAKLSDAVVGTGIPHMGRGHHGQALADLRNVMGEVSGIRRLGSAALDLAYVAAGRMDGFWEDSLSPWDVAAGILMVREAGGFASDRAGGQDIFGSGTIVVGNESIHKALLGALQKKRS